MSWKTFMQVTALGYMGFRGARTLLGAAKLPEYVKAGLIDPNKREGQLRRIPEQRSDS